MSGLVEASRSAIANAEVIFGGPRHLALVEAGARGRPWPTPFDLAPVLAQRGRRVVVLTSGDPFWFGAGGSLAAHVTPTEWRAFPAPSTFSLAASRLGWRLEDVHCLGLHAQPFTRALPVLTRGARLICLLRDGPAVKAFADWLTQRGFGASRLHVLEALGGPRERIRSSAAQDVAAADVASPVAVAFLADGAPGLPRSPGLPDDAFGHDGQITKAPIRALTMAALAPRPGERLWDLGAGSGSISVEWCLAGGQSSAVEIRADRAAQIRANALAFGVEDSLQVLNSASLDAIAQLPRPDAVFVGGGADDALLDAVWAASPEGSRLVVNAVTLETEALLMTHHGRKGGALTRIEVSQCEPLGQMRGWLPSRPVVQWRVIR